MSKNTTLQLLKEYIPGIWYKKRSILRTNYTEITTLINWKEVDFIILEEKNYISFNNKNEYLINIDRSDIKKQLKKTKPVYWLIVCKNDESIYYVDLQKALRRSYNEHISHGLITFEKTYELKNPLSVLFIEHKVKYNYSWHEQYRKIVWFFIDFEKKYSLIGAYKEDASFIEKLEFEIFYNRILEIYNSVSFYYKYKEVNNISYSKNNVIQLKEIAKQLLKEVQYIIRKEKRYWSEFHNQSYNKINAVIL